jgi:DNA-binding MarR family transcriptional regulator
VNDRFSLPALLSQVLVAYTIEFDNEFERRMPHRTTRYGSTPGSPHAPWLVSLAMWENCMRFVDNDGVTVQQLGKRARTTTNLKGMIRWGYIAVAPNPADPRPKPPRRDWVIRATPAGRKAQEIWKPLFAMIEERWRARFGNDEIDRLRQSLWAQIRQFEFQLPDCLPILGYGLFSRRPDRERPVSRRPDPVRPELSVCADDPDSLPLSALLSRVLLAFAVVFERKSKLSLAICSNVVRLLDEKGVRVRDLPHLSGVSKESIKISLGYLEKCQCVVVERESSVKTNRKAMTKIARLTSRGQVAKAAYLQRLAFIEARWEERFGREETQDIRQSLERLVGDGTPENSPLFAGLEPYSEGWRAAVPRPQCLPQYPMVTHRGGYPDGS